MKMSLKVNGNVVSKEVRVPDVYNVESQRPSTPFPIDLNPQKVCATLIPPFIAKSFSVSWGIFLFIFFIMILNAWIHFDNNIYTSRMACWN